MRIEIIDDRYGRGWTVGHDYCELIERLSSEANLPPKVLIEQAIALYAKITTKFSA